MTKYLATYWISYWGSILPIEPQQRAAATDNLLAPYAANELSSRGRVYEETGHRYRGAFQRDRDRIIHASAFRRLVYKTQVFVNHEGDLYRSRLTHSLEVAQIARTVAGALGLNETLAEAISLAHDVGHTPFGHAGQDALNRCMREFGGFEHNLQSLRVVDELEEKYAEFPGLNLCFETREGILKHCSASNARKLGELGVRFLDRNQPGLEAQLANLADEIAYNNHDVDDGLRAELLEHDALREVTLYRRESDTVLARYPGLDGRRLVYETVRRMVDHVVTDLIETSAAKIKAAGVDSIDAVRAHGSTLINLSEVTASELVELKQFLRKNLYRHYRVMRMTVKAQNLLTQLFEVFMNDIRLMPDDHNDNAQRMEVQDGDSGRARAVADYIAGMTDRFAISEHSRLFNIEVHT